MTDISLDLIVHRAVLEGDVEFAGVIRIVEGNAVLVLAAQLVDQQGTAGITVRLNVLGPVHRLPDLGKGLLKAVGGEMLLPGGQVAPGHLHGMGQGDLSVSDGIGRTVGGYGAGIRQKESVPVLRPDQQAAHLTQQGIFQIAFLPGICRSCPPAEEISQEDADPVFDDLFGVLLHFRESALATAYFSGSAPFLGRDLAVLPVGSSTRKLRSFCSRAVTV